jgi:hypothetical protein
MKPYYLLLLLPFILYAIDAPNVEYRMDECFWLDGANGVTGDAEEEVTSADATSAYLAEIGDDGSNPTPCNYGIFLHQENSSNDNGEATDQLVADDQTTGDVGNTFTVSFWLHPHSTTFPGWVAFVTKTDAVDWDYGWGFGNPNNSGDAILRFFINSYDNTKDDDGDGNSDNDGRFLDHDFGSLHTDHWYHIVGTYDHTALRLYVDGVEVNSTAADVDVTVSNEPLRIGSDYWGVPDHDIDEVKIWGVALSASDINTTYQNEKNGKNFDGTDRVCNPCTPSISKHTWQMIGIPADLRTDTKTVDDIFGDDMSGNYRDNWRVYKRAYNPVNNDSNYTLLAIDDVLEFGVGYWLGSQLDSNWSENGTSAVDYNVSCVNGQSSTDCVEIKLRSVSLDADKEDTNGTGPYRYNLSGFIGKKPINWADCRIVVDGNAYTPSESEDNNVTSKTIWMYDSESDAYITCDDTTPGGCKLVPYQGFWVELQQKSKDKNISVLIPNE